MFPKWYAFTAVLISYLVGSLSSLHTLTLNLIIRDWIWNYPCTPYWEFELTHLKDSIIVGYSESDLPLSSNLPLYNYCLSLWDSISTDLINAIKPVVLTSCCSDQFIYSLHSTFTCQFLSIIFIASKVCIENSLKEKSQLPTLIVLPPTLYMGSSKIC